MSEIGDLALAIKSHSDRVMATLRSGREARERVRVCHAAGGPLKTKQGLQDGTDINKILARWMKHGTSVAHWNPQEASYGDFSSGLDYSEALNALKAAEREFATLPARVRAHVGNDPAEFLQLVFDPERRDELEGLDIGYRGKPVRDPAGAPESGGDTTGVEKETVKVEGEPKAVPQGGE